MGTEKSEKRENEIVSLRSRTTFYCVRW
jgi:hypothetical protein